MSDYQDLDYPRLLAELQPRPIRSDAEYRRRLAQIEELMRPDPSPDVSAMIELLALIIEAWETEHYPTPESSPEQMLNHLMEARGILAAEVALELGISPSTLSNYRSGKRRLPLDRVKQLADYFSVSPTVFMGSVAADAADGEPEGPSDDAPVRARSASKREGERSKKRASSTRPRRSSAKPPKR
jgi:HTH-type transcriptional regulator/antitoxin HigA